MVIANRRDEIREKRNKESRIRRHLRDMSDPFRLDEESFVQIYRIPKDILLKLINDLKDDLPRAYTVRRIRPSMQVLITVRFFATGGYQRDIGLEYLHPVDQSTCSRIINNVTRVICNKLAKKFIQFPNNRAWRYETSSKYKFQAANTNI